VGNIISFTVETVKKDDTWSHGRQKHIFQGCNSLPGVNNTFSRGDNFTSSDAKRKMFFYKNTKFQNPGGPRPPLPSFRRRHPSATGINLYTYGGKLHDLSAQKCCCKAHSVSPTKPCDHCTVCGDFGRCRTLWRTTLKFHKHLEKLFLSLSRSKSLQLGHMRVICIFCSEQYVSQTVNKYFIRCNKHCSAWRSIDVTADKDKGALSRANVVSRQNHLFRFTVAFVKHPQLHLSTNMKINVFKKLKLKLTFQR